MKTSILRLAPWLVATLLLVGSWALVILVAIEVSQTVLDTLHQIVELAQLTP